jgi:ATP-binding cassette subfamily B protein
LINQNTHKILPLQIEKGEICFQQVTFEYEKNKKVFNNLNVRIYSGQKVGLVGFSGSGKSTFINLLLRLYEPQQGSILIDNQLISASNHETLMKKIAVIPQDPILFHRSIIENIRYGRIEAKDFEVIEASKKALCHQFIMQLKDEYQTLIGERGIKLSGGQRQRISIARAILKNAPILILDEATSSLDSITEDAINNNLHQFMKNKTVLVITHRLSSIKKMDRLLVFHEGFIIEDGTLKELLNLNKHFAIL